MTDGNGIEIKNGQLIFWLDFKNKPYYGHVITHLEQLSISYEDEGWQKIKALEIWKKNVKCSAIYNGCVR